MQYPKWGKVREYMRDPESNPKVALKGRNFSAVAQMVANKLLKKTAGHKKGYAEALKAIADNDIYGLEDIYANASMREGFYEAGKQMGYWQ